MKVQFSERKGIPLSSVREGKVEFDKCLRTSTTLFVTLLLSPETLNTISKPEFALMQNDILIVNVARGGIVNEEALVQSLIDKQIGGAATDVVRHIISSACTGLVKIFLHCSLTFIFSIFHARH